MKFSLFFVILTELIGIFLRTLFFIILIFYLPGCQSSNLIDNFKKDFEAEKKVKVFNIQKNEKFHIPLNGMILVNENDTIYSIANKYNAIPKDIIEDNNLVEPYDLKFNQILFLRNKNFYEVRLGDNLEKISLKFAVKKSDIIKINKLLKPYKLSVGDKILIPFNKDYSVVDLIINKKIYKTELKSQNRLNNFKKKAQNTPKFIWPIKGEITKTFGKFGKGQHYDGIDIKTPLNTPIYSIYDGTIAFTGSNIKKFGNLILIKHNNGWLSAYSNVGKFVVKQGSLIKQGDVVAFSSGDKEFFHFQIRHNRNPVNPLLYLN